MARNPLSENILLHHAPQVYFIRCGPYVKIGYTLGVLKNRMGSGTFNPYPMEVLFSVITYKPKELEAKLHSALADKRARGEWFELTDQDVEDVWYALDLAYGNS